MRKLVTLAALILGVVGYSTPARADICDLTTAGSTCGPATLDPFIASGAIFTNVNPRPTGTGFIDPFLRLQNTTTEQGYNTSAEWDSSNGGKPFQFDQKNPSFEYDPLVASAPFKGYTRDLLLGEVPLVSLTGTNCSLNPNSCYREFWLDINEPNGNKALLSLDELQLFLSPTGLKGVKGESEYTGDGSFAGLPLIYDLDAGAVGGDNWIKMNYDLGSGSGSGDMVAYIPNSAFLGASNSTFVYLYSAFGDQTCCRSADGFEEWWVRRTSIAGPGPQSAVPEPASLFLVGAGLAAVGTSLRKRRGRRP